VNAVPRGDSDAALARLADFVAALPHLPWFDRVGATLTSEIVGHAETYVAALSLPACPIAPVATWRAAAGIAQRPDWSRDWWQAEHEREQILQRRGAARFGLAPLLAALTDVTEAAAGLRDCAAAALARADIDDETLAKVAGGAAAQACHQTALALLAGDGGEPAFGAKHALFAAGRWPLGVVGGSCFVF
jgi:hypothetical protein